LFYTFDCRSFFLFHLGDSRLYTLLDSLGSVEHRVMVGEKQFLGSAMRSALKEKEEIFSSARRIPFLK
jgi:hypothetical protein